MVKKRKVAPFYNVSLVETIVVNCMEEVLNSNERLSARGGDPCDPREAIKWNQIGTKSPRNANGESKLREKEATPAKKRKSDTRHLPRVRVYKVDQTLITIKIGPLNSPRFALCK